MTTPPQTPETPRRVDGSVDPVKLFTGRPFIGWLALLFYATAAFLAVGWFNGSTMEIGIAAVSCLVTGALLSAVGQILILLREIRDQGR